MLSESHPQHSLGERKGPCCPSMIEECPAETDRQKERYLASHANPSLLGYLAAISPNDILLSDLEAMA